MSKRGTLEAYDAIAPVYSEYSSNRKSYLDTIDSLVISRLSPDMRLLDIGAGDGRRLLKMKKQVGLKDIVAVEPSSGMARICREQTGIEVFEICAEDINRLDIGMFDTVTALWNVFGHVGNNELRVTALRNVASLLKPGGTFMLDVNNRHNAMAYGVAKVIGRTFIDFLNFNEKRGDASYEWKIGDQVFQGSGHLFIPAEIENLFKKAGLRVQERLALDYNTGRISTSKYCGQLFYRLCRA